MAGVPVMLNVVGRRCVIVGGGGVALRRATALVEAGAQVVVIAPRIDAALEKLNVTLLRRPYQHGDLAGCMLALAATDDSAVNEQVNAEAAALGALVSRADRADLGDVTFMAHERSGTITVAVDTGGRLPGAAKQICAELAGGLEAWSQIVAVAGPARRRIRRMVSNENERSDRIARLTDALALSVFQRGGAEAYRRHCETLAQPAPMTDSSTHE